MASPHSPRHARRMELRRTKSQWRTFSHCWRRVVPASENWWSVPASAVLILGLMPGTLTPARAVTAAATAYYQAGSDGNYSTNGNFHNAPTGGAIVMPDGSDGTFYNVINTTGNAITHDHSTGTGGVDTISGLSTNGSFYLTGGTLSGNAAGASFAVSGTGSVFQISNATLRNFTVSGSPTTITGTSTLDTDVFQSGLSLAGTAARIINTLSLTNNAVATISAGGVLSASYGTTGAVTLSGPVQFTDGNGNNTLGVENGVVLTLASGSLVHGVTGDIGAAPFTGGNGSLVNNGTISSDGGGTITLDGALTGVANNGTLQAKNNSVLQLNTAITNGSAGVFNILDTSGVLDNGVSVTGGTVTGSGKMNFTGSGGNILNGVTFNGATLNLTNGGDARFQNSLTLTGGSVATIAAGGTLSASFGTTGAVTLSGPVQFTDGNGNNTLGVENGVVLTLASGSLVHGVTGDIGAAPFTGGNGSLVNNGTISSDGGGTITLDGALTGVANNGTLQAKNNSVLQLNTAITNGSAGVFNILDTSGVLDNGVSVTGGTVTGSGKMNFTGSGGNILNGVTFNGATLNLTNGGDARFQNSLTLTGGSVATIAAGGTLSAANVNNAATLSGPVDFTDGNGNNTLGVENGVVLTLASGSLVHGVTGDIGAAPFTGGDGSLVNNGTISSDGGGTITLDGALTGVANNGILQAKSNGGVGSTLQFNTNVDNTALTGGTAGVLNIADTASQILDNGHTVTGGTVTGPGNMNFTGNATNFLNGVTFNGATLNLTNGGDARFQNSLTLMGGSVANIGAGGTLSAANVNNAATLSGPVDFTDGNGNNELGVENGVVLTLASGSLVHGVTGDIGAAPFTGGDGSLVNNGTISSDGGGTITLDGALTGVANNGLLQAKNGSTLRLDTNVDNTALTGGTAGVFNILDTSGILDNGHTVTGGTVTGPGNMNFTGNATNFLNGVTFNGATLNLTNGGDARFQNSLTLMGGSVANIGAGGTLSAANVNNAATLSGPVDFTDGNGNNELGVENGVVLTLASGSLVHGVTGDIGAAPFTGGDGSLVNNGTISSDGGGTITLDGALSSVTSNGSLQAANGSTLNSNSNVTGSGTIDTDKTSAINFNAGSSLNQKGGTSQVDGAVTLNGTFTVSSGTLDGTGTLNGNVVNSGGTVKPGDTTGTLTVNGNYSQPSGNLLIAFTNSANSLLNITGTASTGGTVQFSFLDSFVSPATVGETFDFLASTGLSTSITNPLFTQYFSNETVGGLVTEAGPGGGVFRIAQDPANANDLQVTVISAAPAAAPEPSQWAAFAIGLLGLGALALKARKRMA